MCWEKGQRRLGGGQQGKKETCSTVYNALNNKKNFKKCEYHMNMLHQQIYLFNICFPNNMEFLHCTGNPWICFAMASLRMKHDMRFLLLAHRGQFSPHLLLSCRIHACRWFIQDQDGRISQDAQQETQLKCRETPLCAASPRPPLRQQHTPLIPFWWLLALISAPGHSDLGAV